MRTNTSCPFPPQITGTAGMLCIGVRHGQARPTPESGAWDLSPPRLHPVAVTLQRYTTQEVILQDYRIPPKVSTATRAPLALTCLVWGSGWRWDLEHEWVTWGEQLWGSSRAGSHPAPH